MDYAQDQIWAVIPRGIEILVDSNGMGKPLNKVIVAKNIRVKLNRGGLVMRHHVDQVTEYLGAPPIEDTGSYCVSFGDKIGSWGSYGDYKVVDMNLVKIVDAPKKAERKDTGPTISQLMQVGSKWKLTQDVDHYKARGTQQTAARSGYTWTEYEHVKDGTLPSGTLLTVVTKAESKQTSYSAPLWPNTSSYEMFVRFRDDATGTIYDIKVAGLKECVEQIGEAEAQPVFVIQDSLTGHYYRTPEYGPDAEGVWRHGDLQMGEKFTQAKKWKRLSDVRSALLNMTGYYDGLPTDGSLPDWLGGPATIEYKDVPRTWTITKVDKISKKTLETIELFDTLDRAWRLRDLTVKYGSGVRSLYSELEKKNKLGEFSGMLVFTVAENKRNKWWHEGMTTEERAEITEALRAFDSKDIKKGKGASDYAIAVKDVDAAVMIKLQYSGELKCHLVDLTTLLEVVK